LSQIHCPRDLPPNGADFLLKESREAHFPIYLEACKDTKVPHDQSSRDQNQNQPNALKSLFLYFLHLFRFQSFRTVRGYVVDIDLATKSPERLETEKKEVNK
jgi:hypothetical protein